MGKREHLKRLRRIAEAATVGQPNVSYLTFSDGARRLDPNSTRGYYKWLRTQEKP